MAQVELLIGTHNLGKIKEIEAALSDLPLRLRLLGDFHAISSPEETGSTYEENAVLKAQFYSQQTGIYALADDSGLEVQALGGAPGIFSARYAGAKASDEERINLLLSKLSGTPTVERRARFICAMAIAHLLPMKVTIGACEGRIAHSASGTSGFGFDPVFVPEGYSTTFAELSLAVKNRISHRAKALMEIRRFLTEYLSRA